MPDDLDLAGYSLQEALEILRNEDIAFELRETAPPRRDLDSSCQRVVRCRRLAGGLMEVLWCNYALTQSSDKGRDE